MDESLNMNEIVKFFVENSGLLFFYTRDDVKDAYNKIYTILNSKKEFMGLEVEDEINELKVYYDYFLENFDEYNKENNNKQLFVDIMKLDSSIMYCGSNSSFELYLKDVKKQLVEANSARSYFNKRRAIKDGLKNINDVVNKINEYKMRYNIDVENAEIDNVLHYLNLNSLAKEEDIVIAYNEIFKNQYENFARNKTDDSALKLLKEESDKLSYIRSILVSFYDVDDKLENRKLINAYKEPLNTEPEYYKAFRYFGLSSLCSKEVMIDTVENYIDSIMITDFVNSLRPIANYSSSVAFADEALKEANYYKDILYRYFDIKEHSVRKTVVATKPANPTTVVENSVKAPVVKKINATVVKKNTDDISVSYSSLFSGLDYNESRKLYYSMMNSMLSSSTPNNAEIMKLESFWNSIKDDLIEQEDNVVFSKPKK